MTDDLSATLRALADRDIPALTSEWKPQLFRLDQTADRQRVTALVESVPGIHVVDSIEQQIAGLLETRKAGEELSDAELSSLVEAHLRERQGTPDPTSYGVWVYYPWHRQLVHVLPREEYFELRTSRNHNKITREEQARLRGLCMGVVGLSVGQATAVTLALESVGESFRLADFDHLELSNMNRLRAGAHTLGLPKTVITAREIFEINPFAEVELFNEGIDEGNIDRFLAGDGTKLDLLFEECDDLAMKFRLRERARDLGIPVLMETSDRGMIDVERFDREPNRPVLHGLAGHVVASELQGLTTYQKVPIFLRIVGADSLSNRLAASLVDIDTTLKTWPQLASAVALGGALNTDCARRIVLGSFESSGRYYVDLEERVSDEVDGSLPEPADYEIEVSEEAREEKTLEVETVQQSVDVEHIRKLLHYATMAPSGGNCQPWRFEWDGTHLDCFHVVARSEGLLDFEHSASHLAFGALLETLEHAAAHMGLGTEVDLFPSGTEGPHIFRLGLDPAYPRVEEPWPLELLARRVSNRRLSERRPLDESVRAALEKAAAQRGARLQLLTTTEQLDAICKVIATGDRIRFLSETMHRELMGEIRWSREEVEQTRDGLDVATLELTPTDLAGLKLVRNWKLMKVVGQVGGVGLEKSTKKAIAAASAIGLLTYPEADPAGFVRGGRALQNVWLTATERAVAFQPMTVLTYLFARLVRGDGDGLPKKLVRQLQELRASYAELFEVKDSDAELMLFRLAEAELPTARSLRYHVDDVLTVREPG